MSQISDKIKQFYFERFPVVAFPQQNFQEWYQLPIKQQKLRQYRNQTHIMTKPIKQYGFMKKYDTICYYFKYVSSWRPIQLQLNILHPIISKVYNTYEDYIKNGWWKQESHQTYLQEFLIMILEDQYPKLKPEVKRFVNSYDKFVLAFFFTVNLVKGTTKFIKNFSNFVNQTYPPSYFFLYICLRSQSQNLKQASIVNSSLFMKIIGILQSQTNSTQSLMSSPMLSNFNSIQTHVNFEEEEVNTKQFDVDLQIFFETPISQFLVIPKVQMYRIMKICGMYKNIEKDQSLRWEEFLGLYFNTNTYGESSFQYLVSMGVAKATYQLGQKLIENQEKRGIFLQQVFTYVFEILQAIFQQQIPEISDAKSLSNLKNLRKTYQSLKILNQYGIMAISKFTKKILKNNFILGLYKQCL